MPMTGTPAGDRAESNVVHVMRKRMTFAVPGTTVAMTVGVLPKGAAVVGGGAMIITAFNDSGTDVIDVGTSTDGDEYGTDLDATSVGFKVLDELATHDGHSETAEVTVTATYAGQNANATAGVADIIILYTLNKNVAL